jgi:hypothetical protein
MAFPEMLTGQIPRSGGMFQRLTTMALLMELPSLLVQLSDLLLNARRLTAGHNPSHPFWMLGLSAPQATVMTETA